MKAQFKNADASGARHALIFGADELARGEVGPEGSAQPRDAASRVALEPVDALASPHQKRADSPFIISGSPEKTPWPPISTSKNRNSSIS